MIPNGLLIHFEHQIRSRWEICERPLIHDCLVREGLRHFYSGRTLRSTDRITINFRKEILKQLCVCFACSNYHSIYSMASAICCTFIVDCMCVCVRASASMNEYLQAIANVFASNLYGRPWAKLSQFIFCIPNKLFISRYSAIKCTDD